MGKPLSAILKKVARWNYKLSFSFVANNFYAVVEKGLVIGCGWCGR
jgi:hypothetical protein